MKYILMFFLYAIVDVAYAKYTITCARGQALQAALFGVAIYAIGAFGVIQYMNDKWCLIPIVVGGFLGTYLIVKHEGKKLAQTTGLAAATRTDRVRLASDDTGRPLRDGGEGNDVYERW